MKYGLLTFKLKDWSKSSSDVFSTFRINIMAALAIRKSTCPNFFTASAISLSTSASDETSACTARARSAPMDDTRASAEAASVL